MGSLQQKLYDWMFVLLSIVLDVLHCNQDLIFSVNLSFNFFQLLYEWSQYSKFLRFLSVYYGFRNVRKAFVLNKSKQSLFCWVDLVCFERSFLLCSEHFAVVIEVINSTEAPV